jgi:hypothetical protein
MYPMKTKLLQNRPQGRQEKVLQDWDCEDAPQATPPCCGCVKVLVRDCDLVPQVSEQPTQADQSASMQATGQLNELHAWDCEGAAQATPPCCGCVKVLVRVCDPVPQVSEQPPQEDQSGSMQSAGQLKALVLVFGIW